MKILHRYILKEQLGPFFTSIVIVLMVFVIDFLLEILDLIFNKGAGLALVLKLFFHNLAWMIALAVPMATLIAIIVSFGRLSEDGEIIALRNAGISLYKASIPVFLFYSTVSILMIYFSAKILPEYNYKAKTLMVSLSRKRPTISIKEGYFNEITEAYTIFTKKANYKENKLYSVIIYDKSKGRYPEIIVADSSMINYDEKNDALTLVLYSGEVHTVSDENPTQFTRAIFRRQKIIIT
ncbi:MAG: LptF/LptG family permease, partial [bacterium]